MNLKAVQKLCYGVYIVGSRKEGRLNGQIANAVVQITSNPATVAVSINKENLTHEFIEASKVFSVSILSEQTPMAFIGKFGFKSGREVDKFADTKYRVGTTGCPVILENTVGYMECEVLSRTDVGTHTIFIGKIVECDVLSDSEPMTYAYYHQVKGGKAPKTAPTYVSEEQQSSTTAGEAKYICRICGYVYDPAQGDPDGGVEPGTPFENIPDTWVCPVCGAAKSEFYKAE